MWQMYLLTRMDAISDAGNAISILSSICLILFFIFGGICVAEKDMEKTTYHGWLKVIMAIFLCSLPITLLCPTSKQMAAILVVPKIVNNAKVQEVPDKLMTLATEWLEELRPNKETK